jgi:hypothetical protein
MLACERCSGVGWGRLQNGVLVDQDTPCRVCSEKFERYAKSAAALVIDGTKTKRPELVFGKYVEPPRARTATITVVDGGQPSADDGTDPRSAGFTDEQIQRSTR